MCQRTIDLLFETLRHPYVYPGAGCIETVILNRLPKVWLLCQIILDLILLYYLNRKSIKTEGWNTIIKSKIFFVLPNNKEYVCIFVYLQKTKNHHFVLLFFQLLTNYGLRRGVYRLIKSNNGSEKSELLTDQEFGHLWQPDKNHCQCGLLSKHQISHQIPLQSHMGDHYQNQEIMQKLSKATCQLSEANTSAGLLIFDHYLSKISMYCSSLEASESFLSLGSVISLRWVKLLIREARILNKIKDILLTEAWRLFRGQSSLLLRSFALDCIDDWVRGKKLTILSLQFTSLQEKIPLLF